MKLRHVVRGLPVLLALTLAFCGKSDEINIDGVWRVEEITDRGVPLLGDDSLGSVLVVKGESAVVTSLDGNKMTVRRQGRDLINPRNAARKIHIDSFTAQSLILSADTRKMHLVRVPNDATGTFAADGKWIVIEVKKNGRVDVAHAFNRTEILLLASAGRMERFGFKHVLRRYKNELAKTDGSEKKVITGANAMNLFLSWKEGVDEYEATLKK